MTGFAPHLTAGEVLPGSAVYLRLPRPEELAFIRALWGDAETMAPVGGPLDFPEDAARAWFARMVDPGSPRHCYCLIFTRDDVPVGEISFHRWDAQRRSAELNVKVLAAQRGRGYAKDALRVFLAFFFDRVGGEYLTDDVAPNNWSGQRLLESVGFTRDHAISGGGPPVLTRARYEARLRGV